MKIRLLKPTILFDSGQILTVYKEEKDIINCRDTNDNLCYFLKSDEGTWFEYMPRKLARESAKSLKKLGAKETINSGAISSFLGDGIISLYQEIIWGMYDRIMVEHKATKNKSFSVTKDILKKIIQEAKSESALPIVHVQLIDENQKSNEYVIIRQSDFKDLIDYIAFLQGKREE